MYVTCIKKKQLYNMSFNELYLFYLGFRIFMLSIISQFHFVEVDVTVFFYLTALKCS